MALRDTPFTACHPLLLGPVHFNTLPEESISQCAEKILNSHHWHLQATTCVLNSFFIIQFLHFPSPLSPLPDSVNFFKKRWQWMSRQKGGMRSDLFLNNSRNRATITIFALVGKGDSMSYTDSKDIGCKPDAKQIKWKIHRGQGTGRKMPANTPSMVEVKSLSIKSEWQVDFLPYISIQTIIISVLKLSEMRVQCQWEMYVSYTVCWQHRCRTPKVWVHFPVVHHQFCCKLVVYKRKKRLPWC